MTDKLHKKKKDWPHFDKFYVSSKEYEEGYDRIFGKKNSKSKKTRKKRSVSKK